MAETGSSVVINDIPEELKGYRKALLNAAFGQVFNKDYLASQIPDAQFWNSGGVPAPTVPPATGVVQPDGVAQPDTRLSAAALGGGLGDAASGILNYLQQANRVGYAEGGLARAAAAIEELLNGGGDVILGASGTPLGGYTPPSVVSPRPNIPLNISTQTTTPAPPTPPAVTPPPNTGGIINTPPSGTLTPGNPNPTPPTHVGTGITPPGGGGTAPGGGTPPTQGSGYQTPPMFLANRPANAVGAAQAQSMGYNPAQYADQTVAEQLAAQMGGRTVYTNTVGNVAPPSQAMIDPGGGTMHNAGLIADINTRFANDEGQRQLALDRLREEIRSYGGSTGGFAGGGIIKLASGGFPELMQQSARGGSAGSPAWGAQPASSMTAATSTQWPATAASTPANPMVSPLGVGNTTASQSAPPGMQAGAFNPYQAYGGQRILGMGNQGQVDAGGNLQASELTRQSLAGYSGLPSYFLNGEINADRDAQGRATTPLGIANDTFDTAGNLAINAAQNAQDMSWRNNLESTFGTALSRIAQNPQMFQAGDITLGQLTAPQLNAPTGVSPSQLTSYQMAGPRLVDTSNNSINPTYIRGQELQNYTAQTPGSVDVSAYNVNPLMVAAQNLSNITAQTPGNINASGYNAATINTTPTVDTDAITSRFERNRMGAADQVQGGNIYTDRFIDPTNAQDYMSPYQAAVTDVRRSAAQRAFDEQKANRGAAAIRAGAFGGSRQAVADSIAERDLMNQMDEITATGAQSAYENAQQQYERDRAANMTAQQFNAGQGLQAALANQGANIQVGGQNLNAALATNQLLGDIGLRGQLANQQADLTVAQANQAAQNQSGQFNAGNQQQASLANQGNQREVGLANLQALLQTQGLGANLAQQANLANQSAQLDAGGRNQSAALQSALANQGNQRDVNLANLQSMLQTQGLGANLGQQANLANQAAYMDAAGRNQGVGMQAALANQAALQQANQANLGAALGVQELGANQALQAQLANQNAGLTAGQANLGAALQTQNLARTSGLTAAQANQSTRLSQNTTLLDALARADQLQQQAAQGNFANQLGAMGQQTNSALAANTIGQNRADLGRLAQAQELLRLQAMGQAGAGVDTRTQGALDLGYQDWTNQQNYPYQQMNYLQSLLSGVPMGYNQEGVQFTRTNPLSQIAGLGTAALGAYGAYRGNQG